MSESRKYKKDKKELKEALLCQLVENGLDKTHYISLVNDYIVLWDTKNLLIADIEENGVTVEYNNGGGQKGSKKNDSVSELVKVNNQMLKLLSELGLRGADNKVMVSDEDL